MNRMTIWLLFVVCSVSAQTGTPNYDWYDASPTAEIFYIGSADELAGLANLVNGSDGRTAFNFIDKTVILTDNIDLSVYGEGTSFNNGRGWIPIGNSHNRSFRGSFDGNGKIITGLYMNDSNIGLQYYGLFGVVQTGTLQNLGVVDVKITGRSSVGAIAGLVEVQGTLGQLNGVILNCYSTGIVNGNERVGGIAGTVANRGKIVNSYSTCSVNGNNFAGGIAGSSFSGSIVNSVALNSKVTGETNTGRVSGYHSNVNNINYALNMNYAFSLIEDKNGQTTTWAKKRHDEIDGKNINVNQILNVDFWTNDENWNDGGWDNSIWKFEDGKLPVLKNGGETQPNEPGVYLQKIVDIASASVTANPSIYLHTGNSIFPAFIMWGAGLLEENTDYTMTITSVDGAETSAGINTGIATVTVVGTGNYTGTTAVNYEIRQMEGLGTANSPFTIKTPEQLALLSELVNKKVPPYANADLFYQLGDDIDLSGYGATFNDGKGWMPIGSRANQFKANFNGNGKVITGLYIEDGNLDDVGLFGNIDGGTLQNFSIIDANITGRSNVGVLVGTAISGVIINCCTTGEVSGNSDIGGVAGIFDRCNVQNCYSICAVSGVYRVGGVVGRMSGNRLVNSAALNPSITRLSGTYTEFGRVAGSALSNTLTGNIAFSGMIAEGVSFSDVNLHNNLNGESKTASEIQIESGFPEVFTQAPWIYEEGMLPGLAAAIEMPEHLLFEGDGTEDDPYIIVVAKQLAKLSELVNAPNTNTVWADKHYQLSNDINLDVSPYNEGAGWTPIGMSFSYPFRGKFDGNGKKITGLYINNSNSDDMGLFGNISSSGIVKNLGIENVNITGKDFVGGVAGWIGGSVVNCYTTGTITGVNRVGGIVGCINGVAITGCYSTCAIRGNYAVGGIVGHIVDGNVSGCAALNPSIIRTSGGSADFGRVAGINAGTLTGNIAFNGMTAYYLNTTNNANGIGGESKTLQELHTANGFPEALKQAPWTYEEEMLPRLDAVVQIPEHLLLSLSGAIVAVEPGSAYTGEPIEPEVTVTLNTNILDPSKYEISYTDNTNAGIATVKITGASNYEGEVSQTFTILPKSVAISDLTVADKTYDGSYNATPVGTATIDGKIEGDDLIVVAGSAMFTDKNVANNIIVTFTGYTIEGLAVDNYILSEQPQSVTANITPKELTITGFNITKDYDGATAVTGGLGSLEFVGLVDDETATVNSSGVTATYASADVGLQHAIIFNGNFSMTPGTATPSNYTIMQPNGVTGAITAAATTITNSIELEPVNLLNAWIKNGILHVQGLTKGNTINVYSASGALVYRSIATGEEANIHLTMQGVYIVQSDNRTVKVIFE